MAANVVWLASFPKSGNTWLRVLLANWQRGGERPVDINELFEENVKAVQREAFDSATLLCSGLLHPDEIDRLRPAVYRMQAAAAPALCYVKVHDAYTRNLDGEPLFGGDIARAAIYVIRDPRDVAVSLASHNESSIDGAIAMLNSRRSALCNSRDFMPFQLEQKLLGWTGHVESWLDQTDVPVHLVSYEALQADTAGVFGRVLEFLGETPDRLKLERAVRNSDFGEMQRQEREHGFRERVARKGAFFRRGQAGAWRDELTAEQAARIEEAHSAVMRRFGYLQGMVGGAGLEPATSCL